MTRWFVELEEERSYVRCDLDEATTHLARAFEVILRPWLDNDTLRVRPKSTTASCHLIEGQETTDAAPKRGET